MSTILLQESAAAAPRGVPRVRTLRLALAGCGVVGGELVRLIALHEREIAARNGVRIELTRVLVRGSGRARPDGVADRLTTDVAEFLAAAAEADVVVEAIGGTDTALRIARTALGAGRRFVTANKALLAAHGPALMRLARRHRARLDFESAVGGGIPVLRALREQLPLTGIEAVRGVLNGTTNYILTRLAAGEPYTAALADAQAKGYAEANPARDISGHDAADKLRVLAWLAFGTHPARLPVRVRGIVPHPDRLAADAAALGGVPRLVAEARRAAAGITASVEPVVVAPGSELGQVHGADNVVVVESLHNGRVRLAGPGAGGAPTASALLGDVLRAARPLRSGAASADDGVEESAPHRWLLSVPRAPQAEARLLRVLERAGLQAPPVLRAADALRVVVGPAPWTHVDLALRAAEAVGLGPVASRLEVG
jgi:homoserine dehydrogenase